MESCDGLAIVAIISILLNAVFAAKCCMRKIRNSHQEKSQNPASSSLHEKAMAKYKKDMKEHIPPFRYSHRTKELLKILYVYKELISHPKYAYNHVS